MLNHNGYSNERFNGYFLPCRFVEREGLPARVLVVHHSAPATRKLAHPRMARYQNVKITGMNH